MSLGEQLGYRLGRPNRLQRVVQAVAASRGGAWVFARVLPTLDSLIGRATGGRHTVPSLFAGLPVLELMTIGRRSGQRRTTRLVAVPHRDALALIGTNFGQPSTPAWALNLEAQPRCSVGYRGSSVKVHARPADDREAAEILAASDAYYDGFRRYQGRITGRRLRVFVLEPVASE